MDGPKCQCLQFSSSPFIPFPPIVLEKCNSRLLYKKLIAFNLVAFKCPPFEFKEGRRLSSPEPLFALLQFIHSSRLKVAGLLHPSRARGQKAHQCVPRAPSKSIFPSNHSHLATKSTPNVHFVPATFFHHSRPTGQFASK